MNMAKKEEKEKVGTIVLSKEMVDRIKIRAAVEGITIRELTERIIEEACPPVSSWVVKEKY